MTPDFNLCDVCGDKVTKKARTSIHTGRHLDAAGSMDDTWETVDLCVRCMGGILNTVCKQFGAGEFVLAKIKDGQKAHSRK